MKHPRFLLALALMLTFGLSACGSPQSEDQTTKAAEQFFAERGGGSAAPGGTTDMLNQPSVIGTVESVDGNTIKVKNLQGASTTVRLAANAKIQQEAEAKASEIQSGATIAALGSKKDTAFQATFVQIGGGNLLMGGGMPMPQSAIPAPEGGAPVQLPVPQGGMTMDKPAGGLPETLSGTVEKVDGNTIVVKKSDGSTVTIELAADAKIQKQQEVKPTDIQPGKTIMASGSKQGDVIEATQVQIIALAMR